MLEKINRAAILSALVAIPAVLFVAFQYAPVLTEGFTEPLAQKIFYFHVSSAIAGYLGFCVILVASILYLRTEDQNMDRWAISAAEVGVVLLTVTMLTGPIWAKAEWGVFWRFGDIKLMMVLILWLVYIGYMVLRANIRGEEGSRVAAVYAILGFVAVPISFLAQRLWRSLHPTVIVSGSGGMGPKVAVAFGVSVLAFIILFVALLLWRKRIEDAKSRIENIKSEMEV
ncbi:hypothetical protein AKJ45_02085 [candidate division MSBL1 archaeon SCGC-AAA261F19]|uniref:Cytochrome c assembly protein domain-containing protein n=1 Tax=candidate division MSBL1 archaeon SCGC-AAA261F19 TaxID=1698275 RepID=A0A133V9Z6_9EURY|nr:hypothetical protein AKJ45_02085 [candidate division MSBL1 archaeon SCGC-AAA261F19]